MTRYVRPCACPHPFPLCACVEGLSGPALLARSRWISSVAGWPGVVGVGAAAWVVARLLRPAPESRGCGCGGRA